MDDSTNPPVIHEASSTAEDVSPHCPFCTIASHYQPIQLQDDSNPEWDPDKLSPPGYVVLSTEHVVAFLDIAPLTRGHLLVAPRKHRTKMGDFKGHEMAEIGKVLPLLARVMLRSVLPDIPHDEVDYNIVQNNGPGAAQVIPHVHFHLIPRPPLNYQTPTTTSSPTTSTSTTSTSSTPNPKSKPKSKYPPSKLPTGLLQSYIQFGRGVRHELDDDDAVELVKVIRRNVKEEWEREPQIDTEGRSGHGVGTTSTSKSAIETFTGTAEDAAWIEGSGGLVSNLERRGGGAGIGSGRRGRDGKL